MIEALNTWLSVRRTERAANEQARGYDYAAGRLLRGMGPSTLVRLVEEARGFGVFTHFDRGIELALVDFKGVKRLA